MRTIPKAFLLAFVISILLGIVPGAIAFDYCPPLGPVLPPSRHLTQNALVKSVAANLSYAFEELASAYNSSAISISLTSTHEQIPLLEFHSKPINMNTTGTQIIDSNTIYRIGSISKVYTVLALLRLRDKINWDDPVTKYVPELNQIADYQGSPINHLTTVQWKHITVGALASQLSGLGRDYPSDLSTQSYFSSEDLGFPPLNYSDVPTCGSTATQPPCTSRDFFENFGKRDPVYLPYTTPVYSNVGYVILGLVIEAVTNQTFENYMREFIFKPFDFFQTTVLKPDNARRGAIPSGESWWDVSLGFETPLGGLYTSTHDLAAFGHAILQSKLLCPTETRAWLKPVTHTSSLGSSVGAPWEILRSNNVTLDGGIAKVSYI